MGKIVPANKQSGSLALGAPADLPAFMQGVDAGVEDLGQFIKPPRLKIVQKQSGEAFSDFDTGDLIIVPQRQLVVPVIKNEKGKSTEVGEPFFFVPLFFFPEWCLWNPIEMKGTLPPIRERTTDPKSPMVAKARNPKLWHVPCPEKPDGKPCRYVEHLNFIVVLVGKPEFSGMPMIMSFSKGEHQSGSSFAALVKMRRAPMFGCQFMANTRFRDNAKGDWYGFDVTNPPGDSGVTPFIQEEDVFKQLQKMNADLKEAHAKSMIVVDYDDETEAVDTTGTEF